jgi:hypothetical protein
LFLAIEIAKFSQGAVVLVADDHMVDQLNLQQLTGTNEIPRHFDVGFRGRGFAAYAAYGITGVIPHPVLCRMASRFAHFALGEPFPRAA